MTTISIEQVRAKKQMQNLYSLYVKKEYSDDLHNLFCMELIHWYDPSISIPFMQGLLEEYGAEAFSTPVLRETLNDAFSAFRYMHKLYVPTHKKPM